MRGARVGGPREWIRKRERGRSNAPSPIDGGEGRHRGGEGRRTWEGSPALETTPFSLEHCPMGCRFSATVDGEARKHLIRLCKRSIKLNRGKLVVRGKVSEPKYSQSERKGRMSWDVLAGSDLSLLLGALVLVAPFRRPPSSGSDQLQRPSVSQARPEAGGPQIRDGEGESGKILRRAQPPFSEFRDLSKHRRTAREPPRRGDALGGRRPRGHDRDPGHAPRPSSEENVPAR